MGGGLRCAPLLAVLLGNDVRMRWPPDTRTNCQDEFSAGKADS